MRHDPSFDPELLVELTDRFNEPLRQVDVEGCERGVGLEVDDGADAGIAEAVRQTPIVGSGADVAEQHTGGDRTGGHEQTLGAIVCASGDVARPDDAESPVLSNHSSSHTSGQAESPVVGIDDAGNGVSDAVA